jgi:hypothetical protein
MAVPGPDEVTSLVTIENREKRGVEPPRALASIFREIRRFGGRPATLFALPKIICEREARDHDSMIRSPTALTPTEPPPNLRLSTTMFPSCRAIPEEPLP